VAELETPNCDASIRKYDNDLHVFLKERPFLSSQTLFQENGLQIGKLLSYLILVNPHIPPEIRFGRSHKILIGSTTRL
jgi:hypothetical protein